LQILFDYKAADADELSLAAGSVVTVTSKVTKEPGWWIGSVNNKSGMFPCG
jgi:hypothetical protein